MSIKSLNCICVFVIWDLDLGSLSDHTVTNQTYFDFLSLRYKCRHLRKPIETASLLMHVYTCRLPWTAHEKRARFCIHYEVLDCSIVIF